MHRRPRRFTPRGGASGRRGATSTLSPISPASVDDVLHYLDDCVGAGDTAWTIRCRVDAISYMHRVEEAPNPAKNERVRDALAEIDRKLGTYQRQMSGLRAEHFAGLRVVEPRKETDAQTICMIGLMRCAMLRRGEVVAMRWGDVEFLDDGTGRLFVPRSKTDQRGVGTVLYISGGDCARLRSLRPADAADDERVFPISIRQMDRRIKDICERAGLDGSFSTHSPRIGMAEDLCESGASILEMQHAGRWKTTKMPWLYTRNLQAAKGAIARYYERENEQHVNG